jgi:hypothetical protein
MDWKRAGPRIIYLEFIAVYLLAVIGLFWITNEKLVYSNGWFWPGLVLLDGLFLMIVGNRVEAISETLRAKAASEAGFLVMIGVQTTVTAVVLSYVWLSGRSESIYICDAALDFWLVTVLLASAYHSASRITSGFIFILVNSFIEFIFVLAAVTGIYGLASLYLRHLLPGPTTLHALLSWDCCINRIHSFLAPVHP